MGRKQQLLRAQALGLVPVDAQVWAAMVGELDPNDSGASASTWVGGRRVTAAALPEHCSRHNSPSRAWAIPGLVRGALPRKDGVVLLALEDAAYGLASCLAVARTVPLYSARSGPTVTRTLSVVPWGPEGVVVDPGLQRAVEGLRLAARLVDMPCAELHTDALVAEAEAVAARVGARCEVIQGEALIAAGLGGLWGVGKAAVHKPALVLLERPGRPGARTVAWVGKGLVYDTGGLSLKAKESMPGMKGDMGGAAAVLGAFAAAADVPERILAVLCIAENAIGPEATRPDDILRMHSGRTVEVNNTDAEGRLVLADGLSWLLARERPDAVIDLATLTGAALVATGRVHAGVYSNDEVLESALVAAGRRSGDLVHPFVFAPELFRREFKSEVADMKNSVKDRNNAQASCAAQFILNHLPEAGCPPWAHVDIAGPAWDNDGRGTGFGVGLLLASLTSAGG